LKQHYFNKNQATIAQFGSACRSGVYELEQIGLHDDVGHA